MQPYRHSLTRWPPRKAGLLFLKQHRPPTTTTTPPAAALSMKRYSPQKMTFVPVPPKKYFTSKCTYLTERWIEGFEKDPRKCFFPRFFVCVILVCASVSYLSSISPHATHGNSVPDRPVWCLRQGTRFSRSRATYPR